jgi:hypothetical protein
MRPEVQVAQYLPMATAVDSLVTQTPKSVVQFRTQIYFPRCWGKVWDDMQNKHVLLLLMLREQLDDGSYCLKKISFKSQCVNIEITELSYLVSKCLLYGSSVK